MAYDDACLMIVVWFAVMGEWKKIIAIKYSGHFMNPWPRATRKMLQNSYEKNNDCRRRYRRMDERADYGAAVDCQRISD